MIKTNLGGLQDERRLQGRDRPDSIPA
jgi:hypothetical protein